MSEEGIPLSLGTAMRPVLEDRLIRDGKFLELAENAKFLGYSNQIRQ
jgi:hypothetical protein